MHKAWLGLLVITVTFSGCLDFLDPDAGDDREVRPPDDVVDPETYTVSGVRVHGTARDPLTIPGLGGVNLSAVIYEPISTDTTPDGDPIAFPVVIFLHGWSTAKEMWQNAPLDEPGEQPSPDDPTAPTGTVDLLDRFAREGFIAVAYDSRGFGRSEGQVHVASTQEIGDLRAVMTYVNATFHTNGKWGVTGISYGGGMSLRALADVPAVTTVVAHQGWVDLYDGIIPGNVPKAEWAAQLYGAGQATSRARLAPIVTEWLGKAVQRSDLGTVEAQMDTRSAGERGLAGAGKPLFLCQGLEETLFPQADRAMEANTGFTRSYIHRGGHGELDAECWQRTQDWFGFFLLGQDTAVDGWPALVSVDADPERPDVAYRQRDLDETVDETRYLHEGGEERGFLVEAPSQATFTVEQRLLANPFDVPSGVSDEIGEANPALPEQFRQDPTAEFFESEALEESSVILGAPTLELVLDEASNGTGFQVVASLFHIDGDSGNTRLLTRGAYAHVPGVTDELDGTVTVQLHWTKATLGAGDKLLLKVGGNDQNVYLQYPMNYSVTFTGDSSLHIPYFEP